MHAPVPWGVYVHIPWCAVRCPYCAFAVDARKDRPEQAYTEAVLRQWEDERRFFSGLDSGPGSGLSAGRPHTVFFGGGTPSQADPEQLAGMLRAINALPGAEISAEINPGKLDCGRLTALREIGINRVSLGVQSFQPDIARRLARAHSARDGEEVYAAARRIGFHSVSVDLMFAVPGQTLADFSADLDMLVACQPDHVSLYGLTLEPGTPFARAAQKRASEGANTEAHAANAHAADDAWREMYDLALDRLGAAGIERYEVSNFGREGHRCAHNEHYWRARPWVGLGNSARGFRPDLTRTAAAQGVDEYLANPLATIEVVPAEALAAELIGSTLRHIDGLDLVLLQRMTGLTVDLTSGAVDALLGRGTLLLRRDTDCQGSISLRIRKEDLPLTDYVAMRLCGALQPGTLTL